MVTFTAPASGASGTFAGRRAATATTNSSGVATAAAFTANATAGSYSVTASVSGVATPASFSLTNTAGTAASITATSRHTAERDGEHGVCDGAAGDGDGCRQQSGERSGGDVHGAGSGASGTFGRSATATATTNSSGVATATAFTANATAGSYSVTASVSGVATPASFS